MVRGTSSHRYLIRVRHKVRLNDGAARGQAKQELGLQTYGIEEMVRVAVDNTAVRTPLSMFSNYNPLNGTSLLMKYMYTTAESFRRCLVDFLWKITNAVCYVASEWL